MLKDASLYFTNHYSRVSVIARTQHSLDALIAAKGESGFINPIRVDYFDSHSLKRRIISAIENYGEIETFAGWIHSTAPEAPFIIAEVLNSQKSEVKFYHILGVEAADPSGKNSETHKDFTKYENISYRKIILGFVIEDESSRWLTNAEISNGVIDAVMKNKKECVIGKVRPWEMNPFLK